MLALGACWIGKAIEPMRTPTALVMLASILSGLLVYAQGQPPICTSQMEYGHKNQIDPEPLFVRSISGRVITEVGRPAKELGTSPACLGLFTDSDHRLLAKAVADESGLFKFNSVPPGRYRLVVRDPQDALCVANLPLRIVRWPRGTLRSLVIHMRPIGLDDCSYGDFK